MIKPIDEIPRNINDKRKEYRQKIKDDLQEAMDNGILKFEFVGNDYNFKTLAQTAREEADKMVRKIIHEWSKAHPEYTKRYAFLFGWRDNKEMELIKITSIKGETKDIRRVFCEIKPDMDFIISEYAERKIQEHEERERRRAERK